MSARALFQPGDISECPDDDYVGPAGLKIVEQSNNGLDEVFSTVSHKLAVNLEILHLLGKKDIDATGNGGGNWLYGNSGDNMLEGGGMDVLRGLGGDDVLMGGGDMDYFAFNRAGVDQIVDFVDNLDAISITGVASQADFDALDIKQIEGDVVISFGGGDKIIIEDMLKSEFDFNDIAVI